MFYLLKVLIGRQAKAIDRPFSYYAPEDVKPSKYTRVLVKFGNSTKVVGVIVDDPVLIKEDIEEYNKKAEIPLLPILATLDKKPLLEENLAELARRMKDYYRCPLVSLYMAMLPPSYKPKNSSLSKPKEKDRLVVSAVEYDSSLLERREKELYERIKATQPVFASAALRSKASYQSLLNKGILKERLERVERIRQVKSLDIDPIVLTPEQAKAKEEIQSSKKRIVLLEGVTGSGKTMVYLRLCEEALKSGKSTIVLVPEIALTNHVIALFKTFFSDKVSLIHSNLSPANKLDEFLKIREGKTSIVIGTRSALFAPVKNLSLIIIDEEQSASYKQDTTPFYDARTVAKMRSDIDGCKVVLASATPLVEDRCRAENGIFSHVVLAHKYSTSSTVQATFIDMSDLSNVSPKSSSMLSLPLLEAMKATYERHEQSMLLINRRGYAPIVQCKKCYRPVKCPNCDVPLIYHKKSDLVKCHRCEYQEKFSTLLCPYDNNPTFEELGFGTERVERILKSLFPMMNIARLDRDTSKENQRAAILEGFRKGEYDVLIGTEMIAKGHDFPNVTLSAALSADQSLSIPSFMANETTFDLISQLVGRSGRHEKEGQAFIQTYNPKNEVLILASQQDYDRFYQLEMKYRKGLKFPPYAFLIQVTTQGTKLKFVREVAYAIKNYLGAKLKDKRCDVLGPYDPYEFKINKQFFKRILVKYKDPALIKETFDNLLAVCNPTHPEIQITIDRDPRGD